ncbi:MAG: hypothetical protein KC502_11440 [Myxococcales bacterium]|nr:hypothetical protein [Myxococcales bacterium]
MIRSEPSPRLGFASTYQSGAVLNWIAALAALAVVGCGSNASGGGGYGGFVFHDVASAPCDDAKVDGAEQPDGGIELDTIGVDAGSGGNADVSTKDAVVVDADTLDTAQPAKDTSDGGANAGDTGAMDVPADVSTPDTGNTSLTFKKVYSEVLLKFGCTSSLCHGVKSGELAYFVDSKSAYALIVNKASKVESCQFLPLVLPGKPETSVLYTKIKAGVTTCGNKMPVGSQGLPESAAKLVYDWIAAGAPK